MRNRSGSRGGRRRSKGKESRGLERVEIGRGVWGEEGVVEFLEEGRGGGGGDGVLCVPSSECCGGEEAKFNCDW